jgi:S-adenosylmethionine-diacylgycerolhomoserine-N-methlytransferase
VSARAVDFRVILSLLRGMPRGGAPAERLEAFYGPQAAQYDAFRERLLAGRREMIAMLTPPDGARIVELGGGTGHNLTYFGDALARFESVTVVDLCPALLAQARRRWAGAANVRVVEADATAWRPDAPVDCVYFSYALTMIPDWRSAIDNALAMLKPGGVLGVVDFYVSEADPEPGLARHGFFTRRFWPRWFAHDGVRPSPEPLAYLRARVPDHTLRERRAPVPYLPGLRVPYYIFVGQKRGRSPFP